ncbi:MAG TPA: hypothetical protein VL463_33555 [Kofleriaceae bacterium]|nr:hypothetical protein [Kofleriaceae bacterium]
MPECRRHSDCGDGMQCNGGQCVEASGAIGEACAREVDCGAGLACRLDNTDVDGDSFLAATCQIDHGGGVLGAACDTDSGCRDSTCALGRCVDLCTADEDCPIGYACSSIPRVEAASGVRVPQFYGCIPERGTISWPLAIGAPVDEVWLPVPGRAKSISLVMSVNDTSQRVGASSIVDPTGKTIYELPSLLEPQHTIDFYANPLRHDIEPGLSVIQIPSTPTLPLIAGAYHLTIGSFRPNGNPASETPHATVVAKLDTGTILDLHFYFLGLDGHPCANALDGVTLDASSAQSSQLFQKSYLAALRSIFGRAGVAIGNVTYDDLPSHPDLDGLDASDLGALLSLSTHEGGVNVFFVRTISPAGLLTLVGGTPGTPGIPGTAASGVAVSLDGICYQDWPTLARTTAHALARHMGLYRNKEPDGHTDPIDDSDETSANLMYFSEYGGTDLSDGQAAVLRVNPVLR